MRATGARRAVVLACTVALLGTGCGTVQDYFGQPEVFDTGIEPLALELDGPAYTAAVRGGLLVRNGEASVVVRRASSAAWLPDGRVLAGTNRRVQVVDPAGTTAARTTTAVTTASYGSRATSSRTCS